MEGPKGTAVRGCMPKVFPESSIIVTKVHRSEVGLIAIQVLQYELYVNRAMNSFNSHLYILCMQTLCNIITPRVILAKMTF